MRKPVSLVALTIALGVLPAALTPDMLAAQGQGGGPPEWAPAVRHDTSRPLREIPARPPVSTREDYEVKQHVPAPPQPQPDNAVQAFAVAPLAASGGFGFDG